MWSRRDVCSDGLWVRLLQKPPAVTRRNIDTAVTFCPILHDESDGGLSPPGSGFILVYISGPPEPGPLESDLSVNTSLQMFESLWQLFLRHTRVVIIEARCLFVSVKHDDSREDMLVSRISCEEEEEARRRMRRMKRSHVYLIEVQLNTNSLISQRTKHHLHLCDTITLRDIKVSTSC